MRCGCWREWLLQLLESILAHLHSPKPWHGSFDGLCLLKIMCTWPHKGPHTNDWRLWLSRASAHHSRNIFFAKNIPVCGGRGSGYEWSLMCLHVQSRQDAWANHDCHSMLIVRQMRQAQLRIFSDTRSPVSIQSRPDRIDHFRNARQRAFVNIAF